MTIKQKTERFIEKVKFLFPGLDISLLKYGNTENGKEDWKYFHFNIPPDNSNLLNSPYFYKKTSAVHFTSVHALASMLNEKSIRLYNLHTLNDPREFTFASKIFKLDKKRIDDAKDNLFLMSFCQRAVMKKASVEFNMWRLYGQQGKGVAITFSLANDPKEWKDFHFSKVLYGSENLSHFTQLSTLLDELNSDKQTFGHDFGKLYAFHKSILFKPETEVRLLFDRRKIRTGMGGEKTVTLEGRLIFPIIKSDLFKLIESKDMVRYLQIPVYYNDISDAEKETPLLKIESIDIGYSFGNEAQKIIETIQVMCKENLGYLPEVKQTRLRELYWDIDNS